MVAGFGSGCDAVLFERSAAPLERSRLGVSGWLARRRADTNDLRILFFNGLIDPACA